MFWHLFFTINMIMSCITSFRRRRNKCYDVLLIVFVTLAIICCLSIYFENMSKKQFEIARLRYKLHEDTGFGRYRSVNQIRKSKEISSKVFESRRERVKNICKKMFGIQPTPSYQKNFTALQKLAFNYLIVSEEHRLIFCSIAKVASAQFKRMIIQMSPGSPSFAMLTDDFINDESDEAPVGKFLKPLSVYPETDLQEKLNTFTKIMFVRNPYQRALDAWISKFTSGTLEMESNIDRIDLNQLDNPITELLERHNVLRRSENQEGFPDFTSFHDYIRYLGMKNLTIDFQPWYSHYYDHCLPCVIEYDYIGKLENENEAEYVFGQLNTVVSKSVFQWPKLAFMPKLQQLYKALLGKIPDILLKQFMEKYKNDKEMFGY